MLLTKTPSETEDYLSLQRERSRSVGLVPTMGALHKGHISLVKCAAGENDVTVVSVFVNPDQFNDPADLANYPRDLESDLRLLAGTGCDMVFAPDVEAVYPEPDTRVFDFGNLDRVMEGKYRPGHFTGVARVVSRLFGIIKPDRAYFGEKDIQQLAVIRKMTGLLSLPVEIRACPTLREEDGLAMSSRNRLLTREQRENAPLIWETLKAAARNREMDTGRLRQWVKETIDANPWLKVEYFEIVDSSNLQPVTDHRREGLRVTGCIAVRAGRVRLIDNIFFPNFDPL